MREIIVAGCGPAGMLAAIAAAREGAKVTILEAQEKPGRKLLMTGNGRCNLTNLDPKLPRSYYGTDPETVRKLASGIFEQFSVSDTLAFFEELGLLTMDKNGYVYPYTGQASSVLELLLQELRRLKVKLKFSEKILSATWRDGWWDINTASWTYRCDHLILACGSRAIPSTGSDGSGYTLAKQMGHSIVPVLPALTALNVKGNSFASCFGVRCHAKISLCVMTGNSKDNAAWETLAQDTGELQWTDNGISGIVVFQVSRFASRALHNGNKVRVILDFLPEIPSVELRSILGKLTERYSEETAGQAFSGLLPAKLMSAVLEQMRMKSSMKAGNITEKQLSSLAYVIKNLVLPIHGTRDFEQCQVCTGGVALEEVEAETLNSKICPGLSMAGEILDIDGPCGGYNLQWAWSSGYVAGTHAARKSADPSKENEIRFRESTE